MRRSGDARTSTTASVDTADTGSSARVGDATTHPAAERRRGGSAAPVPASPARTTAAGDARNSPTDTAGASGSSMSSSSTRGVGPRGASHHHHQQQPPNVSGTSSTESSSSMVASAASNRSASPDGVSRSAPRGATTTASTISQVVGTTNGSVNTIGVGNGNPNPEVAPVPTVPKDVLDYVEHEMREIIAELDRVHTERVDLEIEALDLQERQVSEDVYKGLKAIHDRYQMRKSFLAARRDVSVNRVREMADWYELQMDSDMLLRYGAKREALLLGTLRAVRQLEDERDSLDEYLNTLHPLHDELHSRRVINNALSYGGVPVGPGASSSDMGRVVLGLNSVNKSDVHRPALSSSSRQNSATQGPTTPYSATAAFATGRRRPERRIRESAGKFKLAHYPFWIREAVQANKKRARLVDINSRAGTLDLLFQEDPYFRSSKTNRLLVGSRIQLPPLLTSLQDEEIEDDIDLIRSLNQHKSHIDHTEHHQEHMQPHPPLEHQQRVMDQTLQHQPQPLPQ